MTKSATSLKPSAMDRDSFLSTFGGVFELSPWIAENVFEAGIDISDDSAEALHATLAQAFQNSSEKKRLAVLNAHPDLAGKLAAAKRLTEESTLEQASAGLDALTDDERAKFTALNDTYKQKFGFPFIIAVKGLTKEQILTSFMQRVDHDRNTEFATACAQVEKIALLRIKDLLPSNAELRGTSDG